MIQQLTNSSNYADPPRFLTIIHADGLIETFASHGTGIVINRPVASSPEAGNLVDGIIEEALPQTYADIYWPGNLIASGQVQRINVNDINAAVCDVELLNTLTRLEGKEPRYRKANDVVLARLGGVIGGHVNQCPHQSRIDSEDQNCTCAISLNEREPAAKESTCTIRAPNEKES